MTAQGAQTSLHLTSACWPVFEFLTNFLRLVKHGAAPSPEETDYKVALQ